MAHVAIWPSPWNYHLENRMFGEGFGPGGAYSRAFSLWRNSAAEQNFQLDTWDLVPAGEADVLWFIDLPRTRKVWEDAKRLFPKAKTVLMVCESPLVCPQMFNPANRRHFDHVVSYEQAPPSATTSSYRLPVPIKEPLTGPDFATRRLLCMVNSNRVEGLWAMRQTGFEGLPGVGRLFNGWRFGVEDLKRVIGPDLYIERRRLAREADRSSNPAIDFYGKGWNGEQISWCPLYRNAPYRCRAGSFVEDRIATLASYRFSLAYENWRGDLDYLTDRLFDGFLAGAVPVYLGDANVAGCVPAGAFVDARNFSSRRALLEHLAKVSEAEWSAMIELGRAFLSSAAIDEFREERFAKQMVAVLEDVSK